MPSPEAKLLSDFLVAPASLRDFVTLRQFTDIFPQSLRDSATVQQLYRELHKLRQEDIHVVRQDIADEVRRSKQMKREYARERRQADDASVAGLDLVALQMEHELAGGRQHRAAHSIQTVHASIEEASLSLKAQIVELEAASDKSLLELQEAVGALSDLRHGRFPPSASGDDIGDEVLVTLKRLEAACTKQTG